MRAFGHSACTSVEPCTVSWGAGSCADPYVDLVALICAQPAAHGRAFPAGPLSAPGVVRTVAGLADHGVPGVGLAGVALEHEVRLWAAGYALVEWQEVRAIGHGQILAKRKGRKQRLVDGLTPASSCASFQALLLVSQAGPSLPLDLCRATATQPG